MKVLVVLLIVLIISTEEVIPSKLRYAKLAKRGQFPWHVGITSSNNGVACSGALISRRHVLTTCSCVCSFGLEANFIVRLGSLKSEPPHEQDSVVVTTDRAFTFYRCVFIRNVNDIALIDLKKDVQLSDYIKWIPMNGTIVGPKLSVTLSGWKKKSNIYYNEYLQVIRLIIAPNNMCNIPNIPLGDTLLCCPASVPNFQNECDIDYGSPLVKKDAQGLYVLIGLLSIRAHKCHYEFPTDVFPTAYVRISSVRQWILDHMML